MKVELKGDALKLLYDFLKYGKMYPVEMSDVIFYDLDGFNRRRNLLEKAIDNAANVSE